MAPADPEAKIQCPTPQHLQAELDSLASILALGEKEETWDKMEKALIRFAGITRGGGYKHLPLFTDGIGRKGCASKVAGCMLSDRGRLSTAAVEFLQAFAPRLHQQFAPVVQSYFEPLLKLFARPNKVFLKRSERCLTKILENCQLPQIILELRKGLNDDAVTCRRICSAGIEKAMNQWEIEVFTEKSLISLEEGLRRMATDKDAEVRQTGKRVWTKFTELWPERVDDFSAPLTPTIRRYLNLPAQGIVAKGKGKAKAIPPARPAAVSSTSAPSQSTSRADAARPQPLRVAALTVKPSRPALRQAAPADPEPRQTHTQPIARREPSPKKVESKKVESNPIRYEAPLPPHQPEPYRVTRLAPGSSRPDVAPLPGRSASHAVLPTTYSSTSISDQNPLARPSRPLLPQSFSTTALPHEASSSQTPYVGRFATGPIRIVRPAPMSSHDEADPNGKITIGADGFMYTPSGATVFGGPSRPPPHAQVHLGHGRKPTMGAAQRRIVTAPMESGGLGAPTRTPAAAKFLTRNVKGKVEEIEEFPFSVPVPIPQSVNSNTQTPGPVSRVAQDSPLLPVLRANVASEAEEAEDLRETSMIQESIEMIRDLEGPVPVELAAQIPLPPDVVDEAEAQEAAVPPPSAETMLDEETITIPANPATEVFEEVVLEEETPMAHTSDAAPSPVVDEEFISPRLDVKETIYRPVEQVGQVEATPIASIAEPSLAIDTGIETAFNDPAVVHTATSSSTDQPSSNSAPESSHQNQSPVDISQPTSDLEPVQHVDDISAVSATMPSPGLATRNPAHASTSPPPVLSEPDQHVPTLEIKEPPSSTSTPDLAVQGPATAVISTSAVVADPLKHAPTEGSSEPSSSTPVTGPADPEAIPQTTNISQPRAVSSSSTAKAGGPARVVSGRLATSKSAQPASSSTAPAPLPPRKPPVPRAAAVSRMVRPVERKPFRPATAAQTAALAKSRVASQSTIEKPTALQSTATSKTVAAEPRSRQVSASSSHAGSSAAPAKVASSTTAPSARAITKPSTLLAPTKASASRAASATSTASQVKPPNASTGPSSALPPVRKERIKLKAALPSFRPVRSGAAAQTKPTLGNGTVKSSTSTRSTTSTSRPGTSAAPIARVKPETIPLPHSPVSASSAPTRNQAKSQVRPEQVALPASPADRLVAKVRPEAMPLPPSPVEKAPTSQSGSKSVIVTLGSSSSRHIRITPAEAVPLPDSPIAATDKVVSTTEAELSSQTAIARPSSSLKTAIEVALPDSPVSEADQLTRSRVARHSIPQVTALQQADRGITPTPSGASTMSDLDSDSDSENGDDLTGVTFKVRPDGPLQETVMKLKPKAHLPPSGDLMEFSTSSRPGVSVDKLSVGSTTPKYTPGRKALVSRDANVSSPLVMRGPLVDEEDDENW